MFFRPRSRWKTQNLMFLAGEASYRSEKYIQGNEFWRRTCLYPLLLGQIFQKKQFFKKMRVRICFFRRRFFFWRWKIESCKSSETRFPKVSRQSEPSSGGKRSFKIFDFFKKCPPEKVFRLGRSFLQNRLKRVFPKFHANRSYPRGGNDPSKFSTFSTF